MLCSLCNRFAQYQYSNLLVIIFTDESSVEVDPGRKGVERHKGTFPQGSVYERVQKMISVMVWGAIGPKGFRTPLLRVEGNINSYKYVEKLAKCGILNLIQSQFGMEYIWMEDNAPSHSAALTRNTLHKYLLQVLDWPPRSPNLNPIEHLWYYLKDKLGNDVFKSENELFERLKLEWQNIPAEIIRNCYSSFLARCIVCLRYGGDSLVTRWKEVHQEHDKYRTHLEKNIIFVQNQMIEQILEK